MIYSIGEFGKQIGVTPQTLRNWDKKGEWKPAHVSQGGTRYYSEEQRNQFLGIAGRKKPKRISVGYCRVSSNKQKDDLERQIEDVKTYMIARGYQFDMIQDIGSGMNYNKKGLSKWIDKMTNGEIDKVVILSKDRLIRFGYELIENLCNKYGTEIEIIDNTKKTEEQELIADFIQLITVFSCQLQVRRANKVKQLIQELIEDDPIQESKVTPDWRTGKEAMAIGRHCTLDFQLDAKDARNEPSARWKIYQ